MSTQKIWFVNVGTIVPDDSKRRVWAACEKHGFVSTGQTPKDVTYICKLRREEIICLYESAIGYLAIGKVLRPAIPIRQFKLEDGSTLHNKEFVNMGDESDRGLFKNEYDERICEYVSKIKWIKIAYSPLYMRKQEVGFFAPRNTVKEIESIQTLKRLEKHFHIRFSDLQSNLSLQITVLEKRP